MKIRHLLIALSAAAAAFACQQSAPEVSYTLNVDKETVSIEATGGEATFTVTSNQDWTAGCDADWLSLDPAGGSASGNPVTVKVTAEDNAAQTERTAAVTITAGELSRTFKVTQKASAEVTSYSIDGKQWLAEVAGTQILFDLGLYEDNALIVAGPGTDGNGFAMLMTGLYEIVENDGTSGTVTFTQYDYGSEEFMESMEISYRELTATTVKVSAAEILGNETVTLTLVEEPYEIVLNQGGSNPSGTVADGKYWFIEPSGSKILLPLEENATGGYPEAAEAIDGKGTDESAFTLTYDPDFTCYTIKDSFGRYLYQAIEDDGSTYKRTISVSQSLPKSEDETKSYMWVVYANGDGTYDVYNYSSWYSITYSPEHNHWEIYDPGMVDFNNLYPALVNAD